jgi:hypothetical protein
MKSDQQSPQLTLKWLFGIAVGISLFLALLMAVVSELEHGDVQGYALFVVFFGLAIALFGCFLIVAANDPITVVNKISVMLLWVMGCVMTAFFLTFVFTDPPPTREYALGAICGLPSLFMAIMGIILYRHEIQQLDKHPFDDPLDQINALKEDSTSLVPIRMGLLLCGLLLVIFIFDLWVAITVPFPQ